VQYNTYPSVCGQHGMQMLQFAACATGESALAPHHLGHPHPCFRSISPSPEIRENGDYVKEFQIKFDSITSRRL
jgi:hypothetical protein